MISVVMGVHRIDDYLLEAIESILRQTYRDFELIIVANGSANEDVARFIRAKVKDHRVLILQSRIPQLAYALNMAIDHARYDYIARMDSDDIADPSRLEKQLKYLINFDLELVGTGAVLIDKTGMVIGERKPIDDKYLDKKIVYKNCFMHPTVMYKKELILRVRGYNSGFNSEDYDLWLRMKREGVRWGNMPELLLKYRIHEQATQGQLLGFAEGVGYSLREFVLKKSVHGFLAIFFKLAKIWWRS